MHALTPDLHVRLIHPSIHTYIHTYITEYDWPCMSNVLHGNYIVCAGVHVGEGSQGENHGRLSELLAKSINILLGFMYERKLIYMNRTLVCIVADLAINRAHL